VKVRRAVASLSSLKVNSNGSIPRGFELDFIRLGRGLLMDFLRSPSISFKELNYV
jgi:hypothetical protein